MSEIVVAVIVGDTQEHQVTGMVEIDTMSLAVIVPLEYAKGVVVKSVGTYATSALVKPLDRVYEVFVKVNETHESAKYVVIKKPSVWVNVRKVVPSNTFGVEPV